MLGAKESAPVSRVQGKRGVLFWALVGDCLCGMWERRVLCGEEEED